MSFFRETQIARTTEARNRENKGRLALCASHFTTVGQGTFTLEDEIEFDCRFVEKPWYTYGHYLDLAEHGDLLGEDAPHPLCSGSVNDWIIESDLYVGAMVSVRVHFPPEDLISPHAKPTVEHCFRFEGKAVKQ